MNMESRHARDFNTWLNRNHWAWSRLDPIGLANQRQETLDEQQ
jgi:hypothetical protein